MTDATNLSTSLRWPGVAFADDAQTEDDRIVRGAKRNIGNAVELWTSKAQLADDPVDRSCQVEQPLVHVKTVSGSGLTVAQARELAAALAAAADEADAGT
jgi:hypothetical protein